MLSKIYFSFIVASLLILLTIPLILSSIAIEEEKIRMIGLPLIMIYTGPEIAIRQ
jgi:hypothetical protein